ncbi:MAG: undecaprenyl-diphosphatase UppP [Gemmataceae bacterium]
MPGEHVVLVMSHAIHHRRKRLNIRPQNHQPKKDPAPMPSSASPLELTALKAVILGIIEGLTEFLPVSSTAHLLLSQPFIGVDNKDPFVIAFSIIIQFGAILAVVALYWKKLLVDRKVILRVIAAFIPTGVLYLIFKVVVDDALKRSELHLAMLAIGGVVIILFETWHREKPDGQEHLEEASYRDCMLLGCFQAIAMIPGVSRSAATILGALTLGWKRKAAVEFSFLLAVPTMAAATLKELYEHQSSLALEHFQILAVGFVTSFLVAILAVKFLLSFIRTYTFIWFGVYRILVGGIGLIAMFGFGVKFELPE